MKALTTLGSGLSVSEDKGPASKEWLDNFIGKHLLVTTGILTLREIRSLINGSLGYGVTAEELKQALDDKGIRPKEENEVIEDLRYNLRYKNIYLLTRQDYVDSETIFVGVDGIGYTMQELSGKMSVGNNF